MLNADTRAIIRDVHDGNINIVDDAAILDSLYKTNIITISLTFKGDEIYNEIMASGDGPEALKEMFRI